jgi:hypothetical protein
LERGAEVANILVSRVIRSASKSEGVFKPDSEKSACARPIIRRGRTNRSAFPPSASFQRVDLRDSEPEKLCGFIERLSDRIIKSGAKSA